jgi:hypothetical protein
VRTLKLYPTAARDGPPHMMSWRQSLSEKWELLSTNPSTRSPSATVTCENVCVLRVRLYGQHLVQVLRLLANLCVCMRERESERERDKFFWERTNYL